MSVFFSYVHYIFKQWILLRNLLKERGMFHRLISRELVMITFIFVRNNISNHVLDYCYSIQQIDGEN